jgi:mannose-6-phosphate isomerase-like protein (cupin superfamily)
MRCIRRCALLLMTALTPTLSHALAASPGPAARAAVDITKADVEAAVRIGMAALAPGNVSVSDRNIKLSDSGAYNVAVAFVTRPATKVPSGRALSHDKITEIYYVVRGSGTQVTGPLANATRQEESTTIGPGFSSTSPISGGRTTRLGPGEMQIIPPGVGHVWTEIAEGGIGYMVIRIDPEHVLGLSK